MNCIVVDSECTVAGLESNGLYLVAVVTGFGCTAAGLAYIAAGCGTRQVENWRKTGDLEAVVLVGVYRSVFWRD